MAEISWAAPECWLTPRTLVASADLGPGLDPVALAAGLQRLAARADVQALVVYSSGEACGYGSRAGGRSRTDSDLDLRGSRWHVLGHAARHGRLLYVAE